MSDELEVLRAVVTRLDRAGIPYMVSGLMALNVYAQPRMTRDIDLVVELAPKDVKTVVLAFQADFYMDEDAVRDAITRRSMFNVKDSHSELQLRDVRNLIRAAPQLDWPYIEKWAGVLAVTDLLKEVRS